MDDGKKQMPDEVSSRTETWREVAEKVQHEHDPKKMTELVAELLARLDQELGIRLAHKKASSRPE